MGELMTKHMWDQRNKEVTADTKKYVVQIVDRYKAAYSYCVFKELRKNLSGNHEQALLLEQRKWQNYNRPLHRGSVYVLHGIDHRKWRRRYCVLQPDYTLEVYDSEEDFETANRARYACKHSSYLVVDNVDAHMNQLVKEYLRDFGYVRENVSNVIKKVSTAIDSAKRPTQHVLALYHKYRGSFYIAADSAVEKDKWIKSLQDAQRQLSGIHCENETQREAFAFAIGEACLAEEHCSVTVKMSGTQEEITADFITDYLANGCKTMLQTKVKGDVYKKFKMWGSISSYLSLSVQSIVQSDYPLLRAKAEAEAEGLKQKMLSSMPQINTVYETACAEIIAGLEANFHDELLTQIVPKIPELVTRMGDSMFVPLREVKDVFVSLTESVKRQVSSTSTEFANNIDRFFLNQLDIAPRNPEVMQNTFQSAIGKRSPFSILAETFPKAEHSEQEARFCVLLQKLLDSAIFTFEILCGEVVAKNAGHLQAATIAKIEGRVLKKLGHDNVVLTKRFLTLTIQEVVFLMLRHIIYYDSRNKLRDYEDFIPAEFSHFMPIANLFKDAVWEKLKEDLKPSITAAFKRLTQDRYSMMRYQSSSTINSNSSSMSDELPLSTKHGSSTSPSPPVQAIVAGAQVAEVDIRHEQPHEKERHDESTVENGVEDGVESPAEVPCDGLIKDGETGECLEKVDENGEVIHDAEVQDGQEEDVATPEEKSKVEDVEPVQVEVSTPAGEAIRVLGDVNRDSIVVADPNVGGEMESTDHSVQEKVSDEGHIGVENPDNACVIENPSSKEPAGVADICDFDSGDSKRSEDNGAVQYPEINNPAETVTEESLAPKESLAVEVLHHQPHDEEETDVEKPTETEILTESLKPEAKLRDEALEHKGENLDIEQEDCDESSPNELLENCEQQATTKRSRAEEEESLENDVTSVSPAGIERATDMPEMQEKISENLDEVQISSENSAKEIPNGHSKTDKDSFKQVATLEEDDNLDVEEQINSRLADFDERDDSREFAKEEEKHVINSNPDSSFSKHGSLVDEEPYQYPPNGNLKQNGHSKPVQDEKIPPVPTRRKKSKENQAQELENIGNDGDPGNVLQARVLDADLEKYNGVMEQIIHTGEEKLI